MFLYECVYVYFYVNACFIFMYRYVVAVAKARGVVYKGLSTKKVLAKLDVYEYKKVNKLNVVGTSKSKRWVPLEDTTRLLHCMFAGGDELITLFSEMDTTMTRQELDDPSIKNKRDVYWKTICEVYLCFASLTWTHTNFYFHTDFQRQKKTRHEGSGHRQRGGRQLLQFHLFAEVP